MQFHGLQKIPELNGRYGVVLRYDKGADRFAVRKEVVRAAETLSVTVKATNLIAATGPRALAELQELLDEAPAGARVTLPRGPVVADGASADTLVINSPIVLMGMGGRSGGTVLDCNLSVGPDVKGELLEFQDFHVNGLVEVAPMDVTRVRLVKVSIAAPASREFRDPALRLDEIGMMVPRGDDAMGRCTLESCWVRGGFIGIEINVVGCLLKQCRVQGAFTFGLKGNAAFALDGCTIGDCGKSGRGGGITAMGACTQLRVAGVNENRIQSDAKDKHYSGYSGCDPGCASGCICGAARFALAYEMPAVKWGSKGNGKWQHMGQA